MGLLAVAGRTVGVVRIGIFQVQGYPALCEQAAAALRVPRGAPCDEACSDRIAGWAYGRLTAGLEGVLRRLRAAGADVLLVDITDNGGGSQWVEAAARILSRRPLTSSRLGFLRSTHWAEEWRDKAEQLRHAAAGAPEPERARLLAWANEAADAARVAATPCPARGSCERLGRAGFATGLVGSAPAGTFAGKPWGPLVFTPAQYEYHDGVFGGPVVVLTDDETWSAAEELAAELQDNRAAVVLGARTGGAGCGHTGEPPTKLTNSGAVLELPDCARFRADGSNEVSGVVPDVPVGLRAYDGKPYQARLVGAKLEEAVAKAVALDGR